MKTVIFAGMLLFSGASAHSQDGNIGPGGSSSLCSDRGAIEAYTRSLDRRLKTLRRRTFGRPFSDESGWREVSGDFEGIVAHVFVQDKKPVVVAFGISSESGDWVQDVTYYYRSDGTLAKKHDLLNTFYGNASVTKNAFYACSGSILWKHTDHLDLKTKKAKPPDPEFIDEPSPDYKRTETLPFFHLL